MLFSIGFIALFIIGGLSGVMHAAAPSDAQQQDTYFIVAHLHYVLFGGSIMALAAGAYYWYPKITGRIMNEGLGKLNFWFVFIGMNVVFFPMHFVGLDGMPRRIYTYDSAMGWDLWNLVSSSGVILLIAGVALFAYNVIRSAGHGEIAGNDPWDGRTLEWSIPSPPPEYNFAEIPTVKGRDPWWEQKQRGVLAQPVPGGSGEEGHSIHLPQPSYWPIVVSIGLLVGAYGLIFNLVGAAIGGSIAMVGVYAWSFEPVNEPDGEANH